MSLNADFKEINKKRPDDPDHITPLNIELLERQCPPGIPMVLQRTDISHNRDPPVRSGDTQLLKRVADLVYGGPALPEQQELLLAAPTWSRGTRDVTPGGEECQGFAVIRLTSSTLDVLSGFTLIAFPRVRYSRKAAEIRNQGGYPLDELPSKADELRLLVPLLIAGGLGHGHQGVSTRRWAMRGARLGAVNFLLFINIIRVLAEKLRGAATAGSHDRRLAKSTLVLIPLFGVSGIIFVFMPPDIEGDAQDVRLSFDLFFNSFQVVWYLAIRGN
ncbi:Parathyroid hormone/parathyroid hormone- peptide receptor [Branchiostoma belcheri]|nr:Parathyroid hormone/parathyroid hormone- peptide receptor [Branchiostoma belcheri]